MAATASSRDADKEDECHSRQPICEIVCNGTYSHIQLRSSSAQSHLREYGCMHTITAADVANPTG